MSIHVAISEADNCCRCGTCPSGYNCNVPTCTYGSPAQTTVGCQKKCYKCNDCPPIQPPAGYYEISEQEYNTFTPQYTGYFTYDLTFNAHETRTVGDPRSCTHSYTRIGPNLWRENGVCTGQGTMSVYVSDKPLPSSRTYRYNSCENRFIYYKRDAETFDEFWARKNGYMSVSAYPMSSCREECDSNDDRTWCDCLNKDNINITVQGHRLFAYGFFCPMWGGDDGLTVTNCNGSITVNWVEGTAP